MSSAKLLAPDPRRASFSLLSPGLRAVCWGGEEAHCGPGLSVLRVQLREAWVSWGLLPDNFPSPPHSCLIFHSLLSSQQHASSPRKTSGSLLQPLEVPGLDRPSLFCISVCCAYIFLSTQSSRLCAQ